MSGTASRFGSGSFPSGTRTWKDGFTMFWKCGRTGLTGGRCGTVPRPADPGEEKNKATSRRTTDLTGVFLPKMSCDQRHLATR